MIRRASNGRDLEQFYRVFCGSKIQNGKNASLGEGKFLTPSSPAFFKIYVKTKKILTNCHKYDISEKIRVAKLDFVH